MCILVFRLVYYNVYEWWGKNVILYVIFFFVVVVVFVYCSLFTLVRLQLVLCAILIKSHTQLVIRVSYLQTTLRMVGRRIIIFWFVLIHFVRFVETHRIQCEHGGVIRAASIYSTVCACICESSCWNEAVSYSLISFAQRIIPYAWEWLRTSHAAESTPKRSLLYAHIYRYVS